jgi:hypothetical protein
MSRSSRGAVSARLASRRAVAAMLGVGCLALLVALAGTSGAAIKHTTVVLGSTSTVPDPSCPELPCQAVGSVTGFQVSNEQTSLPFRVPREGRVKSWSLTLAQPTSSQRNFFNGFFGVPPEARLAILRRVAGTNPPRYNLRSQGSIHVLSPYLGQTVKFGASLKVQKGDIIGITVPTWAPAFSQGLDAKNVWRASREPGKCTNATDVRQGEPQQKIGRRATYGCKYTTARLLYTATVVEE